MSPGIGLRFDKIYGISPKLFQPVAVAFENPIELPLETFGISCQMPFVF
jgi:hypothetical protein